MKKLHALDPKVREQECEHTHTPFSGSIPCTGPRICTMCGAWRIPSDVWKALHADRKHTLSDGGLAFTRFEHATGATVLQPCFVRD